MPYARNAEDGARIWFEDDGGDGPVVVLGGFLDPIALVRLAPIATTLREVGGFRLVFVDHRGHGRSDAPHETDAYATPVRVADVVAVLDALRIDRAHVLGLSWGGRLAFGIAEHAPERLRSIVVIGQQPYAMDPDGPLARAVADGLRDADERGIEPLVEAFEAIAGRYPDDVRAMYLASDAVAMRAAFVAAMREGAVSDDLSTWLVPCLVCVAEGDVDFREQAAHAAEEIPGARFLSVAETDHLGMDTASVDPFLPAILELFSGSD
jgi:pimeloyl-ACP methyl ester carboxylesterase